MSIWLWTHLTCTFDYMASVDLYIWIWAHLTYIWLWAHLTCPFDYGPTWSVHLTMSPLDLSIWLYGPTWPVHLTIGPLDLYIWLWAHLTCPFDCRPTWPVHLNMGPLDLYIWLWAHLTCTFDYMGPLDPNNDKATLVFEQWYTILKFEVLKFNNGNQDLKSNVFICWN
jgi:hypothetical protein